jgi:GlpG protein
MVGECDRRELAQRFSDYLLTLKIGSETRERSGRWAVWVFSEDDVARATEEFSRFIESPEDPQYQVPETARSVRRKLEEELIRSAGARGRDPARAISRSADPCTLALIGISIVVAVWSGLGHDNSVVRLLTCHPALLAAGQLWRLITPVFLHFTLAHIVFNLMWLQHLGGMIERIKGTAFFIVLVLVIAAVSNMAQAIVGGPHFGGMSGVVYGLFGYVWMKSCYEPFDGLLLDSVTVMLMVGWFLAGWTGLIGPIANWAHGTGLVTGMGFGIAPTVLNRFKRR